MCRFLFLFQAMHSGVSSARVSRAISGARDAVWVVQGAK